MNGMLFNVHWASLHFWWLALIASFLGVIYWYRTYKVRCAVDIIAGKWHSFVIQNYNFFRQQIKRILFFLGLLSLIIAFLRPQLAKKERTITQQGRDVVIALDISRSMLATDCDPNRLACAKKKIKQLLAMLSCERVALILFSGSAVVQCPLTTDYELFSMFLDHVDVETISLGTTALDAALYQAILSFRALPERKNKLLVIFTDGEDFSSNLHRIKEEAQKEAIHVFTIGVGTSQGAPIPIYDERGKPIGHQKDNKGNVVISHMNEDILRTLSLDIGGAYISATHDKTDLVQLVDCITKFEKDYLEDKKIVARQDYYHYFALISFVFFALEWIL